MNDPVKVEVKLFDLESLVSHLSEIIDPTVYYSQEHEDMMQEVISKNRTIALHIRGMLNEIIAGK